MNALTRKLRHALDNAKLTLHDATINYLVGILNEVGCSEGDIVSFREIPWTPSLRYNSARIEIRRDLWREAIVAYPQLRRDDGYWETPVTLFDPYNSVDEYEELQKLSYIENVRNESE